MKSKDEQKRVDEYNKYDPSRYYDDDYTPSRYYTNENPSSNQNPSSNEYAIFGTRQELEIQEETETWTEMDQDEMCMRKVCTQYQTYLKYEQT